MNRHLLELQLILIQSRWGRIDEKWKFILQGNSCRHPIKHSPPFRGQTHANMATPYCLFFTSRTQIHCYKTAPLETTIRRFFKKWPIQTKLHGDKSKWNKELLTVKDAWLRLAAAFSPSVKEQIIVFNIIKSAPSQWGTVQAQLGSDILNLQNLLSHKGQQNPIELSWSNGELVEIILISP